MQNILTVYARPGEPIPLGREGENNARQVVFDLRPWNDLYGPGVVQLLAQRSGGNTPYPVAITTDKFDAIWTVTNADTEIPGREGKAELRYYVGETLAKSAIWTTIVMDALGEPSEAPPEPQQDWVNQVLDAANRAEEAAKRAESSGGGSGFSYDIGHGLKVTEGTILEVDTVNNFEGDNTLPITAAAVQTTVGNIEELLKTI